MATCPICDSSDVLSKTVSTYSREYRKLRWGLFLIADITFIIAVIRVVLLAEPLTPMDLILYGFPILVCTALGAYLTLAGRVQEYQCAACQHQWQEPG